MRRLALLLLAIAPLGCSLGGQGQLAPVSSRTPLYGAEGVDEQPKLLTCAVQPRQTASRVHLVVPVRMLVRTDGTVEPGSPEPAIKLLASASSNREDHEAAVEMLRTRAQEAREWAKRNAETCTFEPAQVAGKPVAVPVQVSFMFTE